MKKRILAAVSLTVAVGCSGFPQGLLPSTVAQDNLPRPQAANPGSDILLTSHGTDSVTITGLFPSQAKAGDTITIAGANFSDTAASNSVVFGGGVAATPIWADFDSLNVVVPAGATSGLLRVEVGAQLSNRFNFGLLPSISAISPGSASLGQVITISGSGFGDATGSVAFGGAGAEIQSWSSSQIQAAVPPFALGGPIRVLNSLGQAVEWEFSIVPGEVQTISSSTSIQPTYNTVAVQGLGLAKSTDNTKTTIDTCSNCVPGNLDLYVTVLGGLSPNQTVNGSNGSAIANGYCCTGPNSAGTVSAYDNNNGTYWAAPHNFQQGVLGQDWIGWDFGAGNSKSIVRWNVNFGRIATVLVQYSDNNSTWTTAMTSPTLGKWAFTAFDSPNVGAHRYWRLLMNSAFPEDVGTATVPTAQTIEMFYTTQTTHYQFNYNGLSGSDYSPSWPGNTQIILNGLTFTTKSTGPDPNLTQTYSDQVALGIGNATLTATPSMANGADGQRIMLINVGTTGTITLRDEGTYQGSNLRLDAATLGLGPRQSVPLIFNSLIGDWVQIGPKSNVL